MSYHGTTVGWHRLQDITGHDGLEEGMRVHLWDRHAELEGWLVDQSQEGRRLELLHAKLHDDAFIHAISRLLVLAAKAGVNPSP